jgi:hypothetical protein
MTPAVVSRSPGTILFWTVLVIATLTLALWVGKPVAAGFGREPAAFSPGDRVMVETGTVPPQPAGASAECATVAPNGTCFPYQADRATWSTGMHPSKAMH